MATLYVGESEEACFAEVLADFRPSLDVLSELEEMPCDPETPMPASKVITRKWREQRSLGAAQLKQTCQVVDITSTETLQAFRNIIRIAKLAREIRCFDIDDAALKASGKNGRRFTQTVAAEIYSQGFDGIRYGSRLGAEYHCIAGFIPLSVEDITESSIISAISSVKPVSKNDPALVKVAKTFKLFIEE